MRIAVLRNERPESGDKWLIACQRRGILADIINLCSFDALDKLRKVNYDLCLLRPPGLFETTKSIYDERLYHIVHILKLPCFPSFHECYIYENKKSLAAFLHTAGVNHPKTSVICDIKEALDYVNNHKLPLVAKTSIGAASSGVTIFNDLSTARRYINRAFTGKGIKKRSGPNKRVGTPLGWLHKAIFDPAYFVNRLKLYRQISSDYQRGYVILQEYINHDYEWRIVMIGDSYFAYKKFKVGDKASGAKSLGYANPPFELLDWVRRIAEKHNINTAAFDIFENRGNYLINEIQTIFGHKMDHILEVNGKQGRYLYKKDEWVFEEGMFNSNESYDLRLEVALKLFEEDKL